MVLFALIRQDIKNDLYLSLEMLNLQKTYQPEDTVLILEAISLLTSPNYIVINTSKDVILSSKSLDLMCDLKISKKSLKCYDYFCEKKVCNFCKFDKLSSFTRLLMKNCSKLCLNMPM